MMRIYRSDKLYLYMWHPGCCLTRFSMPCVCLQCPRLMKCFLSHLLWFPTFVGFRLAFQSTVYRPTYRYLQAVSVPGWPTLGYVIVSTCPRRTYNAICAGQHSTCGLTQTSHISIPRQEESICLLGGLYQLSQLPQLLFRLICLFRKLC